MWVLVVQVVQCNTLDVSMYSCKFATHVHRCGVACKFRIHGGVVLSLGVSASLVSVREYCVCTTSRSLLI